MSETARIGGAPPFEGRARSAKSFAAGRSYPLLIWIIVIGIFFPPIAVKLGDLALWPGRAMLMVLLIPATIILFRRDRVASDYFALAVAVWMIAASLLNKGFTPYVLAESIEFFGAYAVARAFLSSTPALRTFIRAFKFVTLIVVALGLLDSLLERNATLEFIGMNGSPSYRLGFIRATSTLEGFELFGTFCVAAAAIFLYSERKLTRLFYVGVAVFGTVLSLSSGPLFGLAFLMGTFCYDRILKKYRWRWKAYVTVVIGAALVIYIATNNPIGWFIRNLTLDPWTGYWRVSEWAESLGELANYPWIGHGLAPWENRSTSFMIFVGRQGVDCVWLVEALRYGYTVVILLLLTIVAPFWNTNGASTVDDYTSNLRTGFSLVIVTMSLIGLTVHFWDADWIFLSLCIGIRASFVEHQPISSRASAAPYRWEAAYAGLAAIFLLWIAFALAQ